MTMQLAPVEAMAELWIVEQDIEMVLRLDEEASAFVAAPRSVQPMRRRENG